MKPLWVFCFVCLNDYVIHFYISIYVSQDLLKKYMFHLFSLISIILFPPPPPPEWSWLSNISLHVRHRLPWNAHTQSFVIKLLLVTINVKELAGSGNTSTPPLPATQLTGGGGWSALLLRTTLTLPHSRHVYENLALASLCKFQLDLILIYCFVFIRLTSCIVQLLTLCSLWILCCCCWKMCFEIFVRRMVFSLMIYRAANCTKIQSQPL